MKSIIFEGSDYLGKTFAAESLQQLYGLQYHHCGIPPDSWDYCHDFIRILGINTIHDRFHLGGLVYGDLLGLHETSYTSKKKARLLRYLYDNAVIVIFHTFHESKYIRRLIESEKKQLYDMTQLLHTNSCFNTLSTISYQGIPYCHFSIDVVQKGFPTEKEFERWIQQANS